MAEIDSFHCRRCNRDVAGADIKRLKAGSGEMLTCATCGDILVKERSRVVKPLAAELATAFLYPFRPMTLVVSLVVALFAGAAGLLPRRRRACRSHRMRDALRALRRLGWRLRRSAEARHGHRQQTSPRPSSMPTTRTTFPK